jgi:hypothetical protein
VAKLLTILFIIIGLLGTIAFYRLPTGWVVPSFQTALNESMGAVELSIPEVQMRWGGWRNPLGIKVHQVTITSLERNLTLKIPDLLISIKIFPLFLGKAKVGKCYFETAQVYTKNLKLADISAKIKLHSDSASLKMDFKNLNTTALIHFLLKKKELPTEALPIQGTLHVKGNHSDGLTSLHLTCISQGGSLIIPEIYPEALHLDSVNLSLSGTQQTISLKKLNIKQGDAHLTVNGSLHSALSWKSLFEKGGKIDITFHGNGGAIPIDNLRYLWPRGLSPKPRKWVVNQLSNGNADQLSTSLQGSIHIAPRFEIKGIEIPQLNGEIFASEVNVDYFGKLPPVKHTKGKCTFTREKFTIDASGIANDILLKSAHIIIHDTHVKDQTIDIDLDLEGPVRNSLEIIDAEPLYLANKLNLKPARITGKALTKVHLAFPLETEVPLDLVMVKAHSLINEGKIVFEAQANGKPILLENGSFELDVSKKSLDMKGQGYLQDVLTQIEWREYFGKKDIPFQRQFLLRGLLDTKKLRNFGIAATDYLEGQAPVNIQYIVDPSSKGTIEGFVDLTPVIMVSPIVPWQKPKGEPAHFKIKLHKNVSQERYILDQATLVAPQLSLALQGKEGNHGNVLQIQNLQIGKSNLKSSIQENKDGIYQAAIHGKNLDLSHILDDSSPEPLIKPSGNDEDHDAQIQVSLSLDEVQLGKNNAIHNVKGNMLYKGNILKWANLKGKPPHNDGEISLSVIPLNKDRQQFTLESDDGGHLLEMLGADYDLEGGHLIIQGIKTDNKVTNQKENAKTIDKSWLIAGNIVIDNFTINRAPLLARLLAAASLQGIVNFFSGRGIHFHNGEAEFSLTPAKLQLQKVRLISPSLGLLLNGSIDRINQKVDFTGELIPLYIVNAILAKIPLLGEWIAGGKEDGVFMTQFTLKGDRKDPALAINPISTVTPGLVREMFTPQEAKS